MGGLPHTSPGVQLQNCILYPPPPQSYSVYFNLAITFQCFHLIQNLKMPQFGFLAQFVGTICSANMQRWMKSRATRSEKVGGHKIDTFGETTTHVELRRPTSGIQPRSPVLTGYRCELGVVETLLTVIRCVANDTCRIAQSLRF